MHDVTHPQTPVFPIVGVGASAGGLEAFTQLLQHLPPDTGLGFVLIQHLDRTHASQLSDALARVTSMPVHQAEHGMYVEPGHVYTIAPNTDLAILAGKLVVSPRHTDAARPHMPVDFFLCSLASELGSRAIGVVLSGSASDGTLGLGAIRTHDGITLSQDPSSAKYPGMPQSAIDAGVVDYCLEIPQLAEELVRLSRHAYVGSRELQSMNEELETAKEELQSVNEELSTLNDELRSRNDEVSLANSDLLNFALTVDMAMLTLDMDRRIRRFTPKAHSVFQLRPSDIGRSIDEIPVKFDVSDLGVQIGEVLATGQVKESEVTDQSGRWYRMHIRPYKMKERISGAIVSLVDIDHLKQLVAEAQVARAEAERANRAKDEFLAMLSHELRTPLSIMLLSAQRLRSGDLDRAESQHTGEVLERATRLQGKLIDDLLDVSRIAAGKLSLDFGAVDLCAGVRDAVAALRPLGEGKGLAVHVSLEPAVAPIWADPARVQQIIGNLLHNAIKFTPHGGQLDIRVDATQHVARVRVTDTGIGIEASFLPQLFTRFAQRDSSITRRHGGLGLGLALVRQLMELHGGTVQAQSAGLGQGAAFTVAFPLAPASESGAVELQPSAADHTLPLAAPGQATAYAGLSGLRVLFIDDDRSTREAVLDVLQLSGVCVELAASAAEGATALARFAPQVIVCDIAMPGEDGYSFIRKLRARETAAGGAIPALALTALASKEDKRMALAAGFQRHMAKPIDIDHLRTAVLELSHGAPLGSQPLPAPAM